MPKSKRNKIVHLTQVKKKGKDHKEDLMKSLEQYVDQYEFVYFFDFDQTKSDRIMNLRLKLKEHGRIFAGRNSLVSLALRNVGARTNTNYSGLVRQVTGHRGLFFTNIECDKFVALLEDESAEFREKLLGYAKLKASDDDTAGGEDDEDQAVEGEGEEAMGSDGDEGAKSIRKRVSFKPIQKGKKKKKAGPKK